MKLSAVILAKNEEKNITRCIKSIDFCDEIIVVDDYSTDKTKAIAESLGAVVFQRELKEDFSRQRNFGLQQANGDWIVYIDADEIVSGDLKKEIKSVLREDNDLTSYRLRRRDYFWEHEMRFGETAEARNKGVIRLIKKGKNRWFGLVHEEYIADDRIGRLNSFVNHYPHPTIKAFIASVNFYSTLRAKELLKDGKTANVFQLILFPLGKFIFNYFFKCGWLDGSAGFVYSFMMSFHSFLVRAKMIQVQFSHDQHSF